MDSSDDESSGSSVGNPEFDVETDAFFNKSIAWLVRSNDPSDKETLNHIVTNAARSDDREVCLRLLYYGYKLEVLNEKGQTALHVAFYHNSEHFIHHSLRYHYDENDHVNYSDCNGLTHLHIACSCDSDFYPKNLAEKYLENGEDVNARFRIDPKSRQSGFTPLHMAVLHWGANSLVELLLKYEADVNAVDDMGRTPLHLLCSFYNDTTSFDQMARTYLNKMEMLLENGSDVNARDKQGNTPLHYVFQFKSYKRIYITLKNDEVPVREMWIRFQLLVDYEADVTASNNAGDTVLHCVVKNLKYSRCLSKLFKPTFDDYFHVKIIDEIFSSHEEVDVNAKNNAGETPLQIAVSMLSVDVVSNLIERNADISNVTLTRGSLSHCFCEFTFFPNFEAVKNAMSIVELLVEKGFEFTNEEKLAFMRFLLQTGRSNVWLKLLHRDKIGAYVNNLINFGSHVQVQRTYRNMVSTLLAKKRTHMEYLINQCLMKFVRLKKEAGFHIDERIFDVTNHHEVGWDVMEKMRNEISFMKATFIKDNVTICDVLAKHPYDVYHYVKNVDLQKITGKLFLYKSIVEGHLTKSLVRNCVEQLVGDCLRILLFSTLPDICNRMIFSYLSNEDILNVCYTVF